ncbi:hypothetical protein [Thioalkalivibrio thiocyanodenitrificans]|uniref:hypothetical protein n=1 Tax=Thioalkalivibrio thiocyanodenitrificans TaxID=243063 RepID=UPI00035EFBAC|nr:hypothetical protein [Thioalkalivibrio thiocyanodenitrificans]
MPALCQFLNADSQERAEALGARAEEVMTAIDYLVSDLRSIGYGGDEEISGADLVDLMQSHFDRFRRIWEEEST